jgi:hypothetical protein
MRMKMEEARKKYEDAYSSLDIPPDRSSKRKLRAWRRSPEYVAFAAARDELNKYNITEKGFTTE